MPLRITTPPATLPLEALDKSAWATKLGSTEAAVGTLIAQMTEVAEQFVGLRLWYRGYREVVEADGDDRLYLTARPVVAVSSVRIGDDDPLTEGTEDDEFEVWDEQGYLYRADCWESGRPFWTVDYTAGWWLPSMGADPGQTGASKLAEARPDVEHAIGEMVTLQWQIDSGDRRIKSARLSSMAVQYETGLWIPKTAHRTLCGLRRLLG